MLSKENHHEKIIVLVAPSGSGKTTLGRRLLKDYPDIKFSISATTRPPRPGETDGEDYYFLSEEEFTQKIKSNELLEWEYYSGNRYGTLRSEVDKLIKYGYFPLLDIEVKGALNVQEIYGSEAVSIFIEPPSMEVLRARLLKRGSETNASLKQRLKHAEIEMAHARHFDYIVVNDDLETAYSKIKAIIEPYIN